MTTTNVQVTFSKDHTLLIFKGEIIAQGSKINNLFAYNIQPIIEHKTEEKMHYSNESNELTLWHHRLGHIGLSTIEKNG